MKFLTKSLFLAFFAVSIDTVDAQPQMKAEGAKDLKYKNWTKKGDRKGKDGEMMKKKVTYMMKEEFGSLWNMTENQRTPMAANQTQWNMMLTAFQTQFKSIIGDYSDNFKKGGMKKGGPGGKGGDRDGKRDGSKGGPGGRAGKGGKRSQFGGKDRVSMLGSNEQCQYNFQCETECCLEPRRKGGKKGGRGGRGRGLVSNELERMLQGRKGGRGGRNDGHDFDESDSKKICVAEKHCDDDDVGYTIWQFFAGLLMGMLSVAVCLQYWFYKKQITQIQSMEHVDTEMQGQQLQQDTSVASPWKGNQADQQDVVQSNVISNPNPINS